MFCHFHIWTSWCCRWSSGWRQRLGWRLKVSCLWCSPEGQSWQYHAPPRLCLFQQLCRQKDPYGRAREGALLFTSCIGEHLILTETINHLCVLEFVKTGQSNMWQSCLEGGKCHLSTVVKSFSKSLIFPCPVCMFAHYGEQIMFLCSGSLLQSRLTDHKQNSLHGCYVKDSPIIRGQYTYIREKSLERISKAKYPPQFVLFFLNVSSHLAGWLELIRGLIASTDHGGPDRVPPVSRFTAGQKVNDGKGCLIKLLGHFGEQVTLDRSKKSKLILFHAFTPINTSVSYYL